MTFIQQLQDCFVASLRSIIFICPDLLFAIIASVATAIVAGRPLLPLRYRIATCLGFGLYGVVVGVFMGASKVSLVNELLPALITVLSGYLAYLATRNTRRNYILIFGPGLITMVLCLLFSTFYHVFFKNPLSA